LSKTIKVEDRVYNRLEEIREKRETFSEAVERLLKVYDTIKTVSDTLGPSHYLMERPAIDAREKATTHR